MARSYFLVALFAEEHFKYAQNDRHLLRMVRREIESEWQQLRRMTSQIA